MHQQGFHLILREVDVRLLFGARTRNASECGFHQMVMVVAQGLGGERGRSRRGEVILREVVIILIGLFLLLYMLSRL
jgi:hypothetical protein